MKPNLLIAVIFLASAGCSRTTSERPESQLETVLVETAEVVREVIPSIEMVVATIRPESVASIAAQITAPIQELHVSLGDVAAPGDLLIKLNETEIRARLIRAEAQLKQAENELARVETLFQHQASNQRDLDTAVAHFDISTAQVTEARTILGYTEIRAPFDGVITHKAINPGDLATPGRTLLVLENPRKLRAEAEVPEELLPNLQPGQEALVVVDSRQIRITGRVSEISPAADPASRTFLAKVDLPANEKLLSGQFARVGIPAGTREVLRVPGAAVLQRGQLELAFVIENGKALLRIVKTGTVWVDSVEILAGLDVGERVAISGLQQLADGQPVETKP